MIKEITNILQRTDKFIICTLLTILFLLIDTKTDVNPSSFIMDIISLTLAVFAYIIHYFLKLPDFTPTIYWILILKRSAIQKQTMFLFGVLNGLVLHKQKLKYNFQTRMGQCTATFLLILVSCIYYYIEERDHDFYFIMLIISSLITGLYQGLHINKKKVYQPIEQPNSPKVEKVISWENYVHQSEDFYMQVVYNQRIEISYSNQSFTNYSLDRYVDQIKFLKDLRIQQKINQPNENFDQIDGEYGSLYDTIRNFLERPNNSFDVDGIDASGRSILRNRQQSSSQQLKDTKYVCFCRINNTNEFYRANLYIQEQESQGMTIFVNLRNEDQLYKTLKEMQEDTIKLEYISKFVTTTRCLALELVETSINSFQYYSKIKTENQYKEAKNIIVGFSLNEPQRQYQDVSLEEQLKQIKMDRDKQIINLTKLLDEVIDRGIQYNEKIRNRVILLKAQFYFYQHRFQQADEPAIRKEFNLGQTLTNIIETMQYSKSVVDKCIDIDHIVTNQGDPIWNSDRRLFKILIYNLLFISVDHFPNTKNNPQRKNYINIKLEGLQNSYQITIDDNGVEHQRDNVNILFVAQRILQILSKESTIYYHRPKNNTNQMYFKLFKKLSI